MRNIIFVWKNKKTGSKIVYRRIYHFLKFRASLKKNLTLENLDLLAFIFEDMYFS